MKAINRFALLVQPKEPYFEWARSIDDDAALMEFVPEDHLTVFLVRAQEAEELESILKRTYDQIFDEELWEWHREPEKWPADRSLELFQAWFDTCLVDTVYDLGKRS